MKEEEEKKEENDNDEEEENYYCYTFCSIFSSFFLIICLHCCEYYYYENFVTRKHNERYIYFIHYNIFHSLLRRRRLGVLLCSIDHYGRGEERGSKK